jgi:hypothetical protein
MSIGTLCLLALSILPARAEASVDTFLEQKLASWQKRLKLEEWNITIQLTPRSELKRGTLGGIKWDKKKHTAVMLLIAPPDYSKMSEAEMLADMEFTIVHELVHLELASLPKSEASRSTEEFAVNQLTEALLGR